MSGRLTRQEMDATLTHVRESVAEIHRWLQEREQEFAQRVKARPRPTRGAHRFVATSGAPYKGRVLESVGCDLRRFHANPVVLWRHDGERLPVGRADVFVDGGRLLADVTFDRRDPLGRRLHSRYRRGFMHAVSIDYDALDYQAAEDGTIVVTWWELTEVSAVPVPADGDAVRIHGSRSLGRRLAEVLRR